jgi:hypothetical protein
MQAGKKIVSNIMLFRCYAPQAQFPVAQMLSTFRG